MTPPTATSPFSRSLRLAVVLTCALIALFAVYVYSEKRIDHAHERRYQSRLLADELRQSSDDLTRMVRTYVFTGNPVYKQHYLDILDIREGRKPRPVNYEGIYWDLVVLDDKPPGIGSGSSVALLSMMQQAGFSEDEFRKLAQAKANSDALTRIEFAAMALVESPGLNLDTRRIGASQMLHDGDYHQAKANIMRPLNEFYELTDQRTLLAVREAAKHATLLRLAFILVGLGLLLALWRTLKTLRTTLGGSVDELHAQIARIGRGNFAEAIAVAPGRGDSVLGWLAQTQRQLHEIERARQQSDVKLLRQARLYAALSTCNQAIVRCTNEQELFEGICRAAVEHGGMKMAWIGLTDSSSRTVRPAASCGAGVEYLQEIHITVAADDPFGRGPTGTAVRNDQPFWCQDYQADPITAPWHALSAEYGWAASAALPLHRGGVVTGAFTVYAGEAHAFDEQAQDLLLEMAADIDHALLNFDREAARGRAQQMDVLRRFMLERLTSDLPLPQILTDFVLKIEATLPGALCSVLLLDDDGQYLRLGAAPNLPDFYCVAIDGLLTGPQSGSCGTAAFTGQRVIAGDIASDPCWVDYRALAQKAGLASCWSEPIRNGSSRALGAFAIYRRTPAMPEPHEIDLIEMAAHLTALTIERKQTEVELQLKSKVFEQGSEAIVITDSQRKIVRVNQAFSRMTGYSEVEVMGRDPRMLSSGRHDAGFYESMWASIQAHGQWQGELWNRRKDGTLYPEWLSISVLRDRSGAVMSYVGIATDISKRKEDEAHIHLLADFDPLTGLPNRRLLQDRIDTALSHAQRHGEPLALMFLDLDRFKYVNDSLGHPVGDELLIQVAQRLKAALRDEDTVCRVGGDEFVLLCTGTDAEGAARVATKLLETAAQPHQIAQQELAITCSIGIALYPADGNTFEALSMSADTAMYRAKQAGRNTFRFFTAQMQAQSARALQLENGLRRALELQQLYVVYQPQVSLHDGRVVGMEALLRWRHPALGQVSPAEFIPIAEESGLILPIGEWVLRTATRQLRAWLDAGLPVQQIAVNLSAVQFRHANLPELVTQVLAEAKLEPQCLELELTEGVAMNDPLGAIAVMDNLQQRGVRMSIDDFGTGYSSLSYLKRFSVYKLKIDQSFVRDITDDPDDKAIVVAIIALARSLGFQTIAEGVETQGQLAFLREQGCDEVQGYLFSQPLPADQFETFVRQHAMRHEGDALSTGLAI
ncbi:MAG: EAL domain-containing protein [Rhodoferax sp.]|uniref:bifunctional diguanylate cyclase/phosphodiesterase n=1 Tax=Rhodoferax sp. TaxID=50421 RepID=UPI002721D15C|nr:EAL domain-containing protein [Rhodoferax sp.]MDO8447210.1 EAL domain-containing protein [Rhodoferax sp.]